MRLARMSTTRVQRGSISNNRNAAALVGDEMVLMPEASSPPLRLGLGSRLTAVSDPGDDGQANQP